MSVERGLMIGGEVVPGTDFVIRDWPAARFDPPDVRPRRLKKGRAVDLLVYHWTGGPCFVGPGSASRAIRNAEARKRDDGSLMSVGYHLLVTVDGFVFQAADLAEAAIHVGNTAVNDRSIGIEHAYPGTLTQARKLGVDSLGSRTVTIDGHTLAIVMPTIEMVRASIKLAETLVSLPPRYGIDIPRRVPVDAKGNALRSRRLTAVELRARTGMIEHYHLDPGASNRERGRVKYDAAGIFTEALLAAGWKGVPLVS